MAALLTDGAALPPEPEQRAYRTRKRLRARRLFRPRREDLRTLGADAVVPVALEGSARPWYVLAEDVPALEQAGAAPPPESPGVNLLAPLDPLVYDRERTRAVFGFDYVWEVYTPAARRRWGYYVLPILWGERLVGRLDPRMDRRSGTLEIRSLQFEPGTDPAEFTPTLAERLQEFARDLGADRIRMPSELA